MKNVTIAFLISSNYIAYAGTMTDLGPGSGFNQVVSSESGSVIVVNSGGVSFKYTGSTITNIGTLGGSQAEVKGISANGLIIVGNSSLASGSDRAFRHIGSTMFDLGTLGGSYAGARAISSDGSTIVGSAGDVTETEQAFKYTGTTMVALGTLTPGGLFSCAYAVSADGSVIVGRADGGGGIERAFRYANGIMSDIGDVAGASWTRATAISADGNVITGYSSDPSTFSHAFKYEGGTMTDIGTLGGGNVSVPTGISANGSVIVGYSNTAAGNDRAFKFSGSTITDLGTLGGLTSRAYGVSADGTIIAGVASNATGQDRAFKYSGSTMVDLGTLRGGYSRAFGVSSDGSTIYGESDGSLFAYSNQSLTDVPSWLSSINGANRTYNVGVLLTELVMEGAHHRPMLTYDRMGKDYQAWATGDFGSSSRARDVHTTIGEAGVNWNMDANCLLGVAIGHGEENTDLPLNGSSTTKGDYVLAELDFRPLGTEWIVSILGMLGSFDSRINRSYETGGGVDFSQGATSLATRSARIRLDGPSVAEYFGFRFVPFASYSIKKTTVDAYTETAGSLNARFNEQSHTAQELRAGINAKMQVSQDTVLMLSTEAIHRLDGAGPALTGSDVGGGVAFSLPGTKPRQDCVRLGFDIDHKLSSNTLINLSAHATSLGESHDISAAISVRRAF